MQNQRARGFTLIEVVFTVVIALILVAVGVPSFVNLVKSNRISASVNDVISGYQLTRSEAAKRGLPVTLCPTSDSNAAEPDCATSADWEDGYIAFVDLDASGTRDSTTEVLLLAHGPMAEQIFVNASASVATGITYGGDGFPVGLVDSTSALVFCDEPGDERRMRIINVSATGRPVVANNFAVASSLRC